MGLPGPKNIQGSVLIAVQNQATGGADMRAHAQTLRDALTAPAAILRRVRWRYRFHSLAGPCCLTGENHSEGIPTRVIDRLIEAGLATGPIMQIATVPVSGFGSGWRLMLRICKPSRWSTSYWRTRAS